MQAFHAFHTSEADLVGFGIRVLLIGTGPNTESHSARLRGLGSVVEQSDDLFEGLEAVIEDPSGYGLVVLDCDSFGGLAHGEKAFAMMADVRHRVPVILISKDCTDQVFPETRNAATVLRAPLSMISMRVGFEHALRGRLALRAN